MNNLSSFLQKFKKILSSQGAHIYVFIEILKDELSVEITKDQVRLQGGVLFVSLPPTTKNVLFLKKKHILGRLLDQAGPGVVDIR